MARKLLIRNGKTSSNEEFICQHMCNHYRRILNAKKVVDTSPPQSYKTRQPVKKASLTNGKTKPVQNRNVSPAMTDRSLSTNSNKASSWGADSFISSSRYHSNCIPPDPSPITARKHIPVDMNLINQITYDTKNGPASYCNQNWTPMKGQDTRKKQNVAFDATANKNETVTSTSKHSMSINSSNESNVKRTFPNQRKSSKMMSKQTESYTPFGAKCRPRILKTEAVSKLRSLRVYYPPRRKKKRETENSWEVSNDSASQGSRSKEFRICVCSSNQSDFKKPVEAVKEQTSSRDSAYNGGVSSLPESRSPTPDHRIKMGCTCKPSENVPSKSIEICKYFNEEESKSVANVPQGSLSPQKTKPEEEEEKEEESFRQMKEDALYVKFIQDITVEVLEKGLFTNKAIKKVMRKHIINNLQTLNKDRMIKEVENLRIQLGVPEDNCFLQIEDNNEDSSSVILKTYPVISDSALSLPENLKEDQTDSKRIIKSISQILPTNHEIYTVLSSDEDQVSVIQVKKKLRGRIPSADSSSEESNPNRKKRPKVTKSKKTGTDFQRVFFSSSSESEETRKRFVRERENGRALETRPRKGDSKKKGPVTFGKMDVMKKLDDKHIKFVVCTNDLLENDRKIKAKND